MSQTQRLLGVYVNESATTQIIIIMKTEKERKKKNKDTHIL